MRIIPHSPRLACAAASLRIVALGTPLLLAAAPEAAVAAALVVNSRSVLGDKSPGDGVCATVISIPVDGVLVEECTLRAALEEANALPGPDTVLFHPSIALDVEGFVTIPVGNPLPAITERLTIDGSSAPGYDAGDPQATPAVQLDGAPTAYGTAGLVVGSGADGSRILAVAIHGFQGHALRVEADDVVVQGCQVGLRNGHDVVPNTGTGILVSASGERAILGFELDPSAGFTGRGNVIVGSSTGIRLDGVDAVLSGNFVGTDPTGRSAETGVGEPTGNGTGIAVHARTRIGRSETLPGGEELRAGNVVSANEYGLVMLGFGGSEVIANSIGASVDGDAGTGSLGNEHHGLRIGDGSHAELRGNVIAGNGGAGILSADAFGGAHHVVVEDNRIGVSGDAATALPNGEDGIHVVEGTGWLIRNNVVSGNLGRGIALDAGVHEVLANHVGTNAAGAELGNGGTGVEIAGPSSRIGAPGEGNVIAGNGGAGIRLLLGSAGSVIEGNLIGTDALGADLGNTGHGIDIAENGHVIGGEGPDEGNVIGFNLDGIHLVGDDNEIAGNWIGTDPGGRELGNRDDGIDLRANLFTGATSIGNVIGSAWDAPPGAIAARGNRIAFNADRGVELGGGNGASLVRENAVRGNAILANGGPALDLFPAGATPNDPGDADGGTNQLQNAPELDPGQTRRDDATGDLQVRYRVDTAPLAALWPLRVDFYYAGPGGEGAALWLGSDDYPQSQASAWRDLVLAPPPGAPAGGWLVAIATDGGGAGNTSELGPAVALPEPGAALALVAGASFVAGLSRRRRRGGATASEPGSTGRPLPSAGR